MHEFVCFIINLSYQIEKESKRKTDLFCPRNSAKILKIIPINDNQDRPREL